MTALQTVNLGTAPAGTDGDPVRTAFVKTNANVAVMNAQAALTSTTLITTAQALTAGVHLGKRVSINLASAGTINLPTASTCAADNVILLRNLGTTVVTLAITGGSGDTVALSRLNAGETALMDTDGVHAWTVLMRGRTNSDNETVNGSCTVNGSETVAGALSALGNTFFGTTGQASISSSGAYSGTSAGYSGSVSVGGTLSVTGTMSASGMATFTGGLTSNSLTSGGPLALTAPANVITFSANGSERGRFDTAGGFHVGETAAWSSGAISTRSSAGNAWAVSGYGAYQSGGGCFLARVEATATPFMGMFFGGSAVGSISTNGSSTFYNTTSDYRLKQNYAPIAGAADALLRIPFYEGEYKSNAGHKEHYVLAHELQAVVPHAVTGEKDALDVWRPVYRDGFDPNAQVEETVQLPQTRVDENGDVAPLLDADGKQVFSSHTFHRNVEVTPADVVGATQDIIPQAVDYSKLVPLLGAALQDALKRIAALESK